MNYRFNLTRRAWNVLCAVVLCGSVVSCSEDYTLDESTPGWLNSSIYDYLTSNGHYTNFVRLIDDLNYSDVLSKTGSKTLFVADDNAFKKFYADNPWGVTSYSELTWAQKKLLLNSAMINNAYLLEMMSSTEGPIAGQCLRRETAADVLDSVPHFNAEDLPVNYNADDIDYWSRFRDPAKGGIYMALDNTAPMMTHFLTTQMATKGITEDDFTRIMGRARNSKSFIYDCEVLESDIVCQNGYINRLDKVLINPQNMAEVLRTNGRTNIFSHMLDRFSLPIFNQALTNRYRELYGNEVDSVWEKRYFNYRDASITSYDVDLHELRTDAGTDPTNPTGNSVNVGLMFDPGWNAYRANKDITKEQDMGVIFAPSDERLYDYFFTSTGGGRFLLDAYAPNEMTQVTGPTDWEHIYRAIDQIPRPVLMAFLRNLMKGQFCNAVPSKFETIKDDAQDPMLDATHLDKVADVLLANNGIIYLMDEVLSTPTYAAVLAPAYVSQDMHVMNDAIWNATDGGIAKNFHAYLKAMSSRFSFFVPKDGFWYIDPASFSSLSNETRAIHFEWVVNEKTNVGAITANAHRLTYDYATGAYTIDPTASRTLQLAEAYNRLSDILETHTIVHQTSPTTGIDETLTGVECDQHYFLSKGGAPIYVRNATQRDKGMTVTGGWGLQHGEESTVIRFDDKTRETNGNGNGMAYQLDAPIVPTIESVYSIMYENQDKYGKFFELCTEDITPLLKELKQYLYYDTDGKTALFQREAEYMDFYKVFVNKNGLPCRDKATGNQVSTSTNVRFFNNYTYTIYLPSNAALEAAINDKNLPTWDSIYDLMKIEVDDNGQYESMLTDEEKAIVHPKAAAMVTYLMNFIKNHFQDNSIFADTPALQTAEYETATINSETGVYAKVNVSSKGNGTLTVTDATKKAVDIDPNFKNQIARDYTIEGTATNMRIAASSHVVMHGINDVLNFTELKNGKYDTEWSTSAAARRFIKKYQIKKK